VNVVQSTSSLPSKGKKKNKGKSKKNSHQQAITETQDPNVGGKKEIKVKCPCMVCKEDQFTKYSPLLFKVHQYL
jgi:hypothetical protein